MKIIMVITVCSFLLLQGRAFAHEGETLEGKHEGDAQMQKLHDMMPMYVVVQSKLDAALEKGDIKAVKSGKKPRTILQQDSGEMKE